MTDHISQAKKHFAYAALFGTGAVVACNLPLFGLTAAFCGLAAGLNAGDAGGHLIQHYREKKNKILPPPKNDQS